MDYFVELERMNIETSTNIITNPEIVQMKHTGWFDYEGEKTTNMNALIFLAHKLYSNENEEYFRTILKKGIEANDKSVLEESDFLGNTLLHFLSLKDERELIDLLLKKEVYISKNKKGKYPESKDIKINEKIHEHILNQETNDTKLETYTQTSINTIMKKEKQGDKKVYHLDMQMICALKKEEPKELSIPRFPGRLFIILNKFEGIENTDPKVKAFSVCLKTKDNSSFSEFYDLTEENGIFMNETLFFPIEDADFTLEGKIYSCIWKEDKTYLTKKIGSFDFVINQKLIKQCQNTILEFKEEISYYTNLIRILKNVFYTPKTKVTHISFKLCFISEAEFSYVEAPVPACTASLIHWISIRKISVYLWFKGFCHVKTSNCTLWKRRMVQWKGIHLLVFNEYSGKNVGDFNVTLVNKSKVNVLESEKLIVVYFVNGERINLFFDSNELFMKFRAALNHFLQI